MDHFIQKKVRGHHFLRPCPTTPLIIGLQYWQFHSCQSYLSSSSHQEPNNWCHPIPPTALPASLTAIHPLFLLLLLLLLSLLLSLTVLIVSVTLIPTGRNSISLLSSTTSSIKLDRAKCVSITDRWVLYRDNLNKHYGPWQSLFIILES